jgi:hypothetical protein
MAEFAYFKTHLPSRGVLYGGRVPEGTVEIRKFSSEEMAILNQQNVPLLERTFALIARATRTPGNFPVLDLLLTDRMALLFAIRALTFGGRYSFRFRCTACGKMSKGSVDTAEDLTMRQASDDLSEPITATLPDSKSMVTLRFLRGTDEERIVKRAARLQMQSNDPGDPSYFHRLALQIVTIDGAELNLEAREQWVRKQTALDIEHIVRAVDAVEPGIEMKVVLPCTVCGLDNETVLPFTADFFRSADNRP